MGNILSNLKEVWSKATLYHRLTLVSITIAFLLVILLLVNWAREPEMALLYGGLDTKDAAEICDKLRDKGIVFQLRDSGSAILVPNSEVYQLRLEMVAEGLPTGGRDGYEILDRDGLGISPFKEGVNYVRAIEGELVRTILLMDGVIGARVHIVSEQRRLINRGRIDASASVYLKTSGGMDLRRENIAAVASLVAGATKGVSPDRVVVVVNGKLEAGDEENELNAMTGSLLEYKMKMEKYLATKAEKQLAQVLGPGRATVTVNCKLATASIQSTTKKYDPQGTVETRVTQKKRQQEGSTTGRGNASPATSINETTKETEMESPYTIEQKVDTPGRIEEITAAVFVDLASAAPASADGAEGADGAAATPAGAAQRQLTRQRVQAIVQKALGLKSADSIEVEDVSFAVRPEVDLGEMEEAGLFDPQMLMEMAKRGSLGLAVIGMLLAFRIVRGKKPKPVASPAIEGGGAGGEGGAANKKAKASMAVLKGADKALRANIVNSLQTDPDQVKQLFLSWVESSDAK